MRVPYFPARGEWRKVEPAAAGFDKAKLDEAVAFAVAHENPDTKDLAVAIPNQFRDEAPYNTLIGPAATARRREWADRPPRQRRRGVGRHRTRRHDVQRHQDIPVDGRRAWRSIAARSAPSPTASPDTCRRASTCSPRSTTRRSPGSTCCGRRATGRARCGANRTGPIGRRADRRRRSGRSASCTRPGRSTNTTTRASTCWRWRRSTCSKQPLPDVLKASIMDPIGASSTWHWEAYDNAWVEIDGKRMKSVTGGGHFGGGMFISAYDMARFGYLFLRNGKWNDRQLISRNGSRWRSRRARRTRLRLLQLVPQQPREAADGSEGAAVPLGAAFGGHVPGQRREHHLPRLGERPAWWSCGGSTAIATSISSSGGCLRR